MHGNPYFCFVGYHDNEQAEAGDTLIHTFVKHNWAHCETRFFYFLGQINGKDVVSTSAIYEKHFDQATAPPAPEYMETFNSIEPQLITAGGPSAWLEQDASFYIPPDATGVIIQCINRDPGVEDYVGVRKKGSSLIHIAAMGKSSHTWAICGVDADRKFEVYVRKPAYQYFWVMGYTGRNVHFLDAPIDYLPFAAATWTDCDVGTQCPGAVAGIFSLGNATTRANAYAIRKKGSTDDRYYSSWHNWAIIGLDEAGKCQVKTQTDLSTSNQVWLTGYIDSLIETHTDAPEIVGISAAMWSRINIARLIAKPKWAIVEVIGEIGTRDWGMKKGDSMREITWDDTQHHWSFIHCNHSALVDFYKEDASVHFYLVAEIP